LKDFRTLTATDIVLAELSQIERGNSERKRKRQVKEAMEVAATALVNTPAICRKSYVHGVVVEAFERGAIPSGRRLTTRENRQRLLGRLSGEAA
jgi:DNA topoisomerase-1